MTEVQFRIAAAIADVEVDTLSDAFPDFAVAVDAVADVIAPDDKEHFLKVAGF